MTASPGDLARRLAWVGRRAAGRLARAVGQALPAEGRRPGPRLVLASGLFDERFYLAQNPDVAKAGLDPLIHYLRHGAREGRDPHPLFDTSYYLARNPDVITTRVNPLIHYLRSGAREGRDPHPLFDTSYYLAENPDVATANVNPLAHFARQGLQEGRRPHPLVEAGALILDGGPAAVAAGASPTLEFVPAHVLAWPDGCAVLARRVVEALGPLEERPLPVGRSLEFTLVFPAAVVEECRLALDPGGAPPPVDVVVEIQGRLGDAAPGMAFRTIVPLTCRDELGWLRVDLRDCRVPAGRRALVRLTPRGPVGAELPLVGGEAWTGRLVGQMVFLRANPGGAAPPEPGPRRALTVVLSPGAGDARTVQAFLARRFPETSPHFVLFDSACRLWPLLSASEVVVFASPWQTPGDLPESLDELTFALHQAGVVTILVDPDRHAVASLPDGASAEAPVRRLQRSGVDVARRFHYSVALGPEGEAEWSASVPPPGSSAATLARGGLADLRASALAARRLHVAIVSVLYRKADVIGSFLEMVLRQAYRGPITVVLVDDASPDDGLARAEAFRHRRDADWPAHVSLRLLRNPENQGNCASRNRGLAAVEADVYIVIDADCLMNRDFVAAHVDEHALPPTGAVCGPVNIESHDRDPVALVQHLEAHPEEVTREAQLQDGVQPDGFVNCITRNFSIHRRHVPAEGLFDEAFAYSARPDSGFGWEDVEMGYRLYRAGVPIVFTPRAFAVHATHPPLMPEARQSVAVARNFERLFTTHPELELVARRWAAGTAGRIEAWAAKHDQGDDLAVARVRARFAAPRERLGAYLRASPGGGRRLRILTYRWHAAHQYELHKLPHDFSLVTGLGESMTDEWPYDQRPLRPNVRLVPASRLRPQEYDLALLHFDENCLFPDLGHGVLTGEWGAAFRHFVQEVRLPKVAICHGTPQFVGQYGLARGPLPDVQPHERERRWLVDALRRVPVVVNSWQALDEWGFANSRVIWHGFDPQEFPPATRQRQVLSHGEDWWRPHYRGAHALARVRQLLGPEVRIEGPDHPGAVLRPRLGNAFAVAQFRAYVDRIRSFTVYLNTTLRSPMPRSRGEAMMCGVVPVSLRNHDVEHFIRHGVNGFYADSPEELAEYVRFMIRHPEAASRVSVAARRTALDVFNHDRYLAEWTALLGEVAGGH